MELENIDAIKDQYMALLSGDEKYNTLLSQLARRGADEPIFTVGELDPEADIVLEEEQRQLSEILLDLHALNNGMSELKDVIDDSISTLDDVVYTIMEAISKQMEQAEDMNMICGSDSAYDMTISVTAEDFEETSAEIINDRTLGASIVESREVAYDIVSISGNGFAGNAYVYEDGIFTSLLDDRSDPMYLMDDNTTTVFEYSRIATTNKESVNEAFINYDNKEVQCTITLIADEPVSSITIGSEDKNLLLRKLEVSTDGVSFTTWIDWDLKFQDTKQGYYNPNYIYGSNIFCFPYSYFVRITLANNATSDDTLAAQTDDGTVQILDAFRKCIALNGLKLYTSYYEDCILVSREMLDGNAVDKVALFATEYIPDHFPDYEFVEYYLIINGEEYEVVPANTGKEGISIIKYSDETESQNENTENIPETIKSIMVKVVIHPYQEQETPYISNLKLCLGKNTGIVYV